MQTKLELEEAVSLLTRDPLPHPGTDGPSGRGRQAGSSPPTWPPPGSSHPSTAPPGRVRPRAADLAGADALPPRRAARGGQPLRRTGLRRPRGSGQAVRIMTGAMLPQGCDAVVRQEDTDCGTETVAVRRACAADNFVPGDDYRAGDVLLPAGLRLNAAAVGLLASLGMARVSVRRRPRVAVFATGDELAEPARLLPGQIYDANRYLLRARLLELGAEPCGGRLLRQARPLPAPWRRPPLTVILITTGGVSVGQRTSSTRLCPPGRGAGFLSGEGKARRAPLYSRCRGTPSSPSGHPPPPPPPSGAGRARAGGTLRLPDLLPASPGPSCHPSPRPVPLAASCRASSPAEVTLPDSQASGSLASLALCSCLVDIPAGTGALAVGTRGRAPLPGVGSVRPRAVAMRRARRGQERTDRRACSPLLRARAYGRPSSGGRKSRPRPPPRRGGGPAAGRGRPGLPSVTRRSWSSGERAAESYFISQFQDADLVLLEGFDHSFWPKLELRCGPRCLTGAVCDLSTLLAVVTDAPLSSMAFPPYLSRPARSPPFNGLAPAAARASQNRRGPPAALAPAGGADGPPFFRERLCRLRRGRPDAHRARGCPAAP